jgi:hypothetical protein
MLSWLNDPALEADKGWASASLMVREADAGTNG